MNKIIVLISILALILMTSGCANEKEIGKYTYQPYGLFDEDEKRNNNIEYEVSIGNVIWGVLLVETIVAPIVIFGWYLYEPVGKKSHKLPKGVKSN